MKEEKNTEKKNIKKNNLSRCYRFFLFFIMVNIDGSLDISNGIFSSASKEIKKNLNINNAKFGSFSTSNSIGKVLGSLLFIMFNQKISRKLLITVSIFLNSFFLFCFKITQNAEILLIIYGLLGLTKTIPTIYIPVWIDQFGHSGYKTIQITSVQLFQSLGKIIGVLINLILGYENWQNGFLISGSYLLILSFCCLISKEDYFSRTLFSKKIQNKNIKNRISSTIFEDHGTSDNTTDNKKNKKNNNLLTDFSSLFKNPLYILSLICGSIVRGLISCLNYWFPDFLRNIINKPNLQLTIVYSIICLVGPFGGIISNGQFKKCIGSYESRKASWPIVILQFIASIFAISIGLTKSLVSVCIITICYLIFNSSVLALIQGILISCVDKKLSATGFAFANICKQIIVGPIPIIYGFLYDKLKDKYPSLPMCFIMSINLLAVPLLICLAILRNKKFDEEVDKNQELIEKETN